ncbi:hypothetical protein [Pseudoroseicyclus tamaricis]|uniref:Pentapeptide repeat protein n=1 Tax=Pseudoroseicyclus tamaricis TaxID=2705421 RepID=A0A6B2JJ36_9RHOB|nr:hypothetical protein [Pseudoroseicyclus tamaricis]NDV01423.1 hypothetical protein [Pseudoroseicyclus tamaricis]
MADNRAGPSGPAAVSGPHFEADCSRCAALCCMALALDEGPHFAIDKPAGTPCPNLSGHACSIHDRLPDAGFPGCAAYDCAGAGQRVVQEVFAGRSWQQEAALTGPMIRAFAAMREVQALHRFLLSAAGLPLTPAQEEERLAWLETLAPERAWDAAALERAAADTAPAIRHWLRSLAPHLAQRGAAS